MTRHSILFDVASSLWLDRIGAQRRHYNKFGCDQMTRSIAGWNDPGFSVRIEMCSA
jgi:hypothetical protein